MAAMAKVEPVFNRESAAEAFFSPTPGVKVKGTWHRAEGSDRAEVRDGNDYVGRSGIRHVERGFGNANSRRDFFPAASPEARSLIAGAEVCTSAR
jgi:hypothetical protein